MKQHTIDVVVVKLDSARVAGGNEKAGEDGEEEGHG